jgi:hypothetical protein
LTIDKYFQLSIDSVKRYFNLLRANELRQFRILEFLEIVNTPESLQLVKRIAIGPNYLRTTREAKRTLDRMSKNKDFFISPP